MTGEGGGGRRGRGGEGKGERREGGGEGRGEKGAVQVEQRHCSGLPPVSPGGSTPYSHLIIVVMSMEERFFLKDLWVTQQVIAVSACMAQESAAHSPYWQACSQSSRGPGSNRTAVRGRGEC